MDILQFRHEYNELPNSILQKCIIHCAVYKFRKVVRTGVIRYRSTKMSIYRIVRGTILQVDRCSKSNIITEIKFVQLTRNVHVSF